MIIQQVKLHHSNAFKQKLKFYNVKNIAILGAIRPEKLAALFIIDSVCY